MLIFWGISFSGISLSVVVGWIVMWSSVGVSRRQIDTDEPVPPPPAIEFRHLMKHLPCPPKRRFETHWIANNDAPAIRFGATPISSLNSGTEKIACHWIGALVVQMALQVPPSCFWKLWIHLLAVTFGYLYSYFSRLSSRVSGFYTTEWFYITKCRTFTPYLHRGVVVLTELSLDLARMGKFFLQFWVNLFSRLYQIKEVKRASEVDNLWQFITLDVPWSSDSSGNETGRAFSSVFCFKNTFNFVPESETTTYAVKTREQSNSLPQNFLPRYSDFRQFGGEAGGYIKILPASSH